MKKYILPGTLILLGLFMYAGELPILATILLVLGITAFPKIFDIALSKIGASKKIGIRIWSILGSIIFFGGISNSPVAIEAEEQKKVELVEKEKQIKAAEEKEIQENKQLVEADTLLSKNYNELVSLLGEPYNIFEPSAEQANLDIGSDASWELEKGLKILAEFDSREDIIESLFISSDETLPKEKYIKKLGLKEGEYYLQREMNIDKKIIGVHIGKEAKRRIQVEEFKNGFDARDGSYRPLKNLVKENMNDPKSFEHVETNYSFTDDTAIILMRYRGNNAFGGKVLGGAKATYTLNGVLVAIEDL